MLSLSIAYGIKPRLNAVGDKPGLLVTFPNQAVAQQERRAFDEIPHAHHGEVVHD